MKKLNSHRFYNVLFPPYLLMILIPQLAVISLVANFIIDSIVFLIISTFTYKKTNGKFYIRNIWKVWMLGFAADIIGAAFLFIGSQVGYFYVVLHNNQNELIYKIMSDINSVTNNAGSLGVYGYVFLVLAILISAIAIFLLNYFVVFKKTDLTKKQKLISSLAFAIITAPYTFLLPNNLFYS